MSISWWASPHNMHTLCRYLVEECTFSAEQLLGVIEKPWNWRVEFHEAEAWQMDRIASSMRGGFAESYDAAHGNEVDDA